MNNFEIFLIRNFPFLPTKKIKLLKKNIDDTKYCDVLDICEMFTEEELSKICTPSFFKYLNRQGVVLFRPSFFTKELLNNEKILLYNSEYIDYILNENISYIGALPLEVIKPKHIRLFEKYIDDEFMKNPDINNSKISKLIIFPVPSFYYKYDVVLEKYLEEFESSKRIDNDYLLSFLNSIYDKEYFVDKILEIIEKRNLVFYVSSVEKYPNLFKNDKVIESLLRKSGDITYLCFVPDDKLDKAYDVICELIKEERDLITTKNNMNNAIDFFKNNYKVIKTILSLDDLSSWAFLFEHIDIDLDLFLPEEIMNLYNYFIKNSYEVSMYKYKMPKGIVTSKKFEYLIENNDKIMFDVFECDKFSPDNINLIFKKIDFKILNFQLENRKEFWDLNAVVDSIKIDNVEEYLFYFDKLSKDYSIEFALIIIKKYKNSNIKSEQLDMICNHYLEQVRNMLNKRFNDSELTEIFIFNVLNGDRNPLSLYNITNKKLFYIGAKYCDILSVRDSEIAQSIPLHVLEKLNRKHINIIKDELKKFQFNDLEAFQLAVKMYVSIGLARSKDLLNPNMQKNYGSVSKKTLLRIFSNISLSDIYFKKNGSKFVPEYNEQWIELIFGENYKIKNTPIRNYLGDFAEKKAEIEKKKNKILMDMNLTDEVKIQECAKLDEELERYVNEVDEFFKYVGQSFNEWDIITEEFIKSKNKSNLGLKMNISKVNEIMQLIRSSRNMPNLDERDRPLLETDVFDFVGYDNKFTSNPETAKKRTVELSRRMDNVKKKKFPNISFSDDGYTVSVYGPQDRRILAAGYKSNCCFRPNGNADDFGKDYSLLNYCVSTEYGGGMEICDDSGELIMFSPLLRNGNVLMIHSIETKYPSDSHMKRVNELLVEFAKKVIEESKKNGDNIDFVIITDLHNLDTHYASGFLPNEKKFKFYNVDGRFSGMYNNLSYGHALLAATPRKTYDDIQYGEVEYSYDYPIKINDYVLSASFTKEQEEEILLLNNLNNEIIELSNKKFSSSYSIDEKERNELLGEIREKKKEYLERYKKILSENDHIDLVSNYKKAMKTIKEVNDTLGIDIEIDIKEVMYGVDWYIVITHDGKLIANCLESGTEKLNRRLNEVKGMYGLNEQEIGFLRRI